MTPGKATSHERAGSIPGDIELFARDMLGLRLLPHQLELCQATEETVIVYKGRQAGATAALMVKLAHAMVTRPRSTGLYTSAGQRQAEDVGERFLDLLRGQPLGRSIVSDTRTTIRFSNMSMLHFLPSNPETLRGYGPRSWGRGRRPGVVAVIDEAPHVDHGPRVRRALQYALVAAPEGHRQLFIVGTPAGVTNWTYPLWQAGGDGEPGIRSFLFPTRLNPYADAALIGRLRGQATVEEQAEELDGVPREGAAALFPGELVDAALDGEMPWPVPPRESFVWGLRGDFSEPWSRGTDRTALIVRGRGWREGRERWVVADAWVRSRHTMAEAIEAIRAFHQRYRLSRIRLERTAAGGVHEELVRIGLRSELVAPTAGAQLDAFRFLYKLLEERALTLPRPAPYLEGELRQCERRLTDTGLVQFGHPLGSRKVHDDTLYALVWACTALADLRPMRPDVQTVWAGGRRLSAGGSLPGPAGGAYFGVRRAIPDW